MCRRIQSIKQGSDVIGNRTRVTVRKNKVAAPFKVRSSTSCTTKASARTETCWTWASSLTSSEKRGAFYRFGDLRLGQGRESAKAFLSDTKDVAAQIDGKIREQAGLPINLVPQEEAEDTAAPDSDGRRQFPGKNSSRWRPSLPATEDVRNDSSSKSEVRERAATVAPAQRQVVDSS